MGKTIVITGAGDGLGRALSRRFARDGETVVLLGRTFSKVEAVATELGEGHLAVQCDIGEGSFLAAYRVHDGEEVWRTAREEIPSWGTPTVIEGPERVEPTRTERRARALQEAPRAERFPVPRAPSRRGSTRGPG